MVNLLKVELINGRKFYACENHSWFYNQVLSNKKDEYECNFVEFTVIDLERKFPFGKYKFNSIDLEIINKDFIISVRDLGVDDNKWFEKHVKQAD